MNFCIHCMEPIGAGAAFCPACGKAQAYDCPENHLKPGTLLGGRFLLGAAIGAGGFGITYIARDTRLGNVVAVKEYYPNGVVNRSNTSTTNVSVGAQQREIFQKGKQKFLDEARLLATLNDEPGVVDVRDYFEENNTAYIVMEYLRGETLKEHIKDGKRIDYREAYRLLLPVMRSLRAVHAMGLVHRDISPDNIMLAQNGVKLLDFGAAREVIDEDKSLSIILKRGYAPIEQYTKKNQGPWTDVYALCATMYRCITGSLPTDALLRREEELPPPSAFGVPMASAFEAVLLKGLELRQTDRFRSMDELIGAFDAALTRGAFPVSGPSSQQSETVTQGLPDAVVPTQTAARTQTAPQPPKTPAQPDAATVAAGETPPAAPAQKKKKAKWPVILVVVLLVAALGGGAFWYITKEKGKEPGTTDPTSVSSKETTTGAAADGDWADVPDTVTVPQGTARLKTPLVRYAYSTDSQTQPYVQLRSAPEKDAEVVLKLPNQYLDDAQLDKAKLTVYSAPVHDDVQDIDRVLCRYTYDGQDVWGWARDDFLHESKEAAAAALEAANTYQNGADDPTADADFSVGSTVTFGTYEQDDNTANGKEPIDWLVLENDGSKALVISKYALDCQPYNTSGGRVTWETCSLRTWLNGTFYDAAFSAAEQSQIHSVTVTADSNPDYSIDAGSDVTDKVFLLSVSEVNEYFASNGEKLCEPTESAKQQGVYAYSNGYCRWWLRTPGETPSYAACVSDSSVFTSGNLVNRTDNAVRPAMWIDLTDDEEAAEEPAFEMPDVSVGDYITFGSYEQDNDESNGKEPIEWLVLDTDGDKALVISKYALDCQPYNEERENVTWETCTLRTWLNGSFYDEAFDASEQRMIQTSTVEADAYGADPGNDTNDKVFLLSLGEKDQFFDSNDARMCAPTEYAIAQGVDRSSDWSSDCKVDGIDTCSWWLRSIGWNSDEAASLFVDGDESYGSVGIREAVRPAMWVRLEA